MSKPGKVLKGLCKKLGVRLTVKRNGKRVYKSIAVLKRQCANKKKKRKVKKKVKRKRRRKFGTSGTGLNTTGNTSHDNIQNGIGYRFIDGGYEKSYIKGVFDNILNLVSGDLYFYEQFGEPIQSGGDDCYTFEHWQKAAGENQQEIIPERIKIPHDNEAGHTEVSNPALSQFMIQYNTRRPRTGSRIGKRRKKKKLKKK